MMQVTLFSSVAFELKSLPQVTHRDTVNMIEETTGAALITKGVYVPPGKAPPEGERKIYLLIEGPTELSVKHAKQVRLWRVPA